ncbi:dehydrogenase/reductase SDR family member 1-like [Paramacrobiotus metropolitanus]|uniref:dehydrogenase/reductase SDR family member 1-like n=1 Tax=Paramacrobiotus metropolitanus TaxID=2943436 RepID=UPI002445AF21|nr:dehydrogenase/reductase SDR family member 1-like [Paramacrobiotus metropolitanus]
MSLNGKVAVVTGASRGIGKGIALQLGGAGGKVYITGRAPANADRDAPGSLTETAKEIEKRGGTAVAVYCDSSKDDDLSALFDRVATENGRLDVLVNNAYAAVPELYQNLGKPFWEISEGIWDRGTQIGLRDYYVSACKAAKIMVPQKSGLIINISSIGAEEYLFTPVYGIGKTACDRMAADCALELKSHGVNFISLWPGAVKTELMDKYHKEFEADAARFSGETAKLGLNSMIFDEHEESMEYAGMCIVALAQDNELTTKSGTVLTTADVGKTYGLKDIPF